MVCDLLLVNFILFLQRLVPGPYTYDDKIDIFLTEFKPINTDLITSDASFYNADN